MTMSPQQGNLQLPSGAIAGAIVFAVVLRVVQKCHG